MCLNVHHLTEKIILYWFHSWIWWLEDYPKFWEWVESWGNSKWVWSTTQWPVFGPNDKSCFVSSYHWCSKYILIDLWKAGLNPTVMRTSLPLQIKCSQMCVNLQLIWKKVFILKLLSILYSRYSPRYDCGARFRWGLRILDSQEKIIRDHQVAIERAPSRNWKTVEHSFKFKQSQADFIYKVRYLVFIHEGLVESL